MTTIHELLKVMGGLADQPAPVVEAAFVLMGDYRRMVESDVLSEPGRAVLAQMMEQALLELADQTVRLPEFINSLGYQYGVALPGGPVKPEALFLAVVEAGYFFRMQDNSLTLSSYYAMPDGFRGDLRDVVAAVIGRVL